MNEVDEQLDAAIREALRLIEEKSSSSSKFFGKAVAAANEYDASSNNTWAFKTFAKFPPTLAEELKEKAKALEKTSNGTVDENEKNTNDAKEMKKKKKKKATGSREEKERS